MKIFSKIASATVVLFTLSCFSSCYKIYDYVKQHPGAEVDVCRVKYLFEQTDTITIHYNAAGDPIDMVKNHLTIGGSWQSDKVFRYDNAHRLTDYIWATKGSDYRLIWHRYGYPKKSIITDSLFTYISDGSGPNPPKDNFSHVTIDSLDAQDRIVKTTDYSKGSSDIFVTTFNYNAKGNLDLPYAVYDNKLSILHTSKVWMLLLNDYSVNNRLNRYGGTMTVTNYNAAGLPLDFTVAPGSYGNDILFVTPYHKLQIAYECE